MVSEKNPEIIAEKNFRSFVLFTSKNAASGYTLCHLENVSFKIVTRKSVVSPINWKMEKYTTLDTKGLKSGTKRINMKMA